MYLFAQITLRLDVMLPVFALCRLQFLSRPFCFSHDRFICHFSRCDSVCVYCAGYTAKPFSPTVSLNILYFCFFPRPENYFWGWEVGVFSRPFSFFPFLLPFSLSALFSHLELELAPQIQLRDLGSTVSSYSGENEPRPQTHF